MYDRLQREFREVVGTTAIIYDQTCATEKRRRRKALETRDPEAQSNMAIESTRYFFKVTIFWISRPAYAGFYFFAYFYVGLFLIFVVCSMFVLTSESSVVK